MKCMSIRLKVFQKHLNSTQIFQKQVCQPICLQNSNIKDNLHQNPGTCNLGWPSERANFVVFVKKEEKLIIKVPGTQLFNLEGVKMIEISYLFD